MPFINEGWMIVWHGEKKMTEEPVTNEDRKAASWRHTGELRFKLRAINALWEAGMKDAGFLVVDLPTSGKESTEI